jgi:glycerophosphoryl diester phosphodiesterase
VSGTDRSWSERRVLSYAHQGGAWEEPSSTLHAIRRAVDAGATGVELDVHATRDGELVVCHDRTVDRTTNGTGEIANLSLAELRQLDNAYWWIDGADVTPGKDPSDYPYRGRAPQDREFGIATLNEALEVIGGHSGVAVNLDIKSTAPQVEPYEESLARQLREWDRSEDVIVASFDDRATAAFREFAPEIATSAGTLATAEFWRAAHGGGDFPEIPWVALQVPVHHGDLEVVDEIFLEAAHERGIAVHVWTIDQIEEMDRLVGMGVDGVITDLPTPLCKLLAERGVAWQLPK